jgi:2-C-methyl-D-erythritol 4-phosphate cytidylyltransferase
LERFAIIAGGGFGIRMGKTVPKQFLPLGDIPVMMHTIRQFVPFCKLLIVSLPKDYHAFWVDLQKKYHFSVPHTLVAGGETRFESVRNALQYVPAEGLVAVHDAVRPFVSGKLIEKCFDEATKYGNAVAALPMTESLRIADKDTNKNVDRTLFYRIQTPQVFRCDEIKEAYTQNYQSIFTDDATVLESQGGRIHLVEGEEQNFKITTPTDFLFAENFGKLLISL